MSALAIENPLPSFTGLDGRPLTGGSVYFGAANLDPRTNPVAVFYDSALTIPATQPLRTTAGYLYRNGAPTNVWAGSTYSVLVLDSAGRQVYYAPEWTGASAANIRFQQNGTGTGLRWLQDKVREFVSVTDFHANGVSGAMVDPTGTIDSTAGIQKAIDYCKSFSATETEVTLFWPAGSYKVTTLNYVSAQRVTNVALGAVNIYGTSVGGTSIINVDGGTSIFTRKLNWQGLFAVQQAVGASYQYGTYINGLIDSRWNMAVSGAFSVNSVYIDFSFDNPQLDFIASNTSGLAVATIFCGQNNVNCNRFYCRTIGSSNMAVASIGMVIAGNSNVVEGDFSSSQIGLKVQAALGTTIISPYMETVKYGVVLANIAKSTTVIGGLYEVGSNGAAFDLDSSENTTILGPRIKGLGGGAARTAFALGVSCYGLRVQGESIDAATIDTAYSGTWRGHGSFSKHFNPITAQWVGFPATAVPSTDPNTLDDYKEGVWTPAGNGIVFASASGTYTKIGDKVTACFGVAFPVTADGSQAKLTGLPFSAGANSLNGAALGFQINPNDHALYGLGTEIIIVNRSGANRTNAQCSGDQYYGVLTYKTA